jgi:hypothetical protein
MKISKNFRYSEFEDSEKAKECGIDNTIPEELKPRIKALVDNVLQPLRDAWGAMPINSGYRCRELNEKVGGEESSQHRTGEASDVACKEPYKLAQLAKDMDLPYDQLILYPTFVHFSHKFNGKQRKQVLYNKSYKGQRLV